MTRRRKAKVAGGIVTALAVLVPLAIQVDRWLLERRQMIARTGFEAAVAECEAHSGRWWRGECVYADR